MSISHRLKIQTSLSLQEIKELLVRSNLGLTAIDNFNGLYGLGITIFYNLIDNDSKKATYDDYGFSPDVSIGFRLARNESETAGDITSEKACAILLAQGTGDAVYFYNLDSLVFKRINGKLTLYDDWADDLIPELNKLGVKYELEKSEYTEEFS
jgi:hypothetical protein